MRKLFVLILIALSLTTLSARHMPDPFFDVGMGLASDVVMTDFNSTEYFESMSFKGEFSIWAQSDPWNLIVGFDIACINNRAMGLRPTDNLLLPSAKIYSMIRFSPFERGFAFGLGGGIYIPGGDNSLVLPMIYAEPSILFESQMRTSQRGWIRLSFPVSVSFYEENIYLNAGTSVILYIN